MTHEQFEKAAQYWENKPQTAMPQETLKKAVSDYRHCIQQWADGHRAQFIFRVHKFLFSFSVQTKKREIVEEQHFLRISRFVSRLMF